MSAAVSAVIVTCQSVRGIASCLDSLRAEGASLSGITVVDNASADGTKELIREKYPDVRLLENGDNLGFAAAANLGIAATKGDFVLILSPDVSFGPGFVAALAAALQKDPQAGAAAPKLVRPEGRLIDSAGLVMKKTRKALDRGRDETDGGAYDAACRVFGPCGAASLMRRSMLEDVRIGSDGEYFDESFFAYKEDADLAWRANLLGWKTVYVPQAVAVHSRGWKVTSRMDIPPGIRRHSHKNRYLTIIKNDDASNLLMHLPWWLMYELKLFVYSLFFEPFLFLAFRDIIRLLPRVLEKRKVTMARRKITAKEARRLFS